MKISSSSRENVIQMPVSENSSNAKQSSIGCMSGIFHFLSRHTHNNSRRRLSSGQLRSFFINFLFNFMFLMHWTYLLCTVERKKTSSTATKEKPPIHQTQKPSCVQEKTLSGNEEIKRHSSEVQCSPTLPSKIRRSSSVEPSLEIPRRPTPLIVKLMGLDEIQVSSSEVNNNVPDQERRKLLNALEKCDSDLKSLKRIIDAVS